MAGRLAIILPITSAIALIHQMVCLRCGNWILSNGHVEAQMSSRTRAKLPCPKRLELGEGVESHGILTARGISPDYMEDLFHR